jgi:hypothetical protein
METTLHDLLAAEMTSTLFHAVCRFAYQADALIDYACGRGGDIHKWHAAKVTVSLAAGKTAHVPACSCRSRAAGQPGVGLFWPSRFGSQAVACMPAVWVYSFPRLHNTLLLTVPSAMLMPLVITVCCACPAGGVCQRLGYLWC